MLALGIFGMFAAVAVIAFIVLDTLEQKSTVRASLRHLTGYEIDNVRDRQLLDPLRQRAFMPFMRTIRGLGQRFTPVGYVDSTRTKITAAGLGGDEALDHFLVIRVLTIVAIPIYAVLCFGVLPLVRAHAARRLRAR